MEFSVTQRTKVARHIGYKLGKNHQDVLQFIPHNIECFGKMKLEDGDMIHGRDLIETVGRDKSFIAVHFFLFE